MNAREHITEAERCVTSACGDVPPDLSASFLAEAKAHAAIALAIATIDLAESTQVIAEQGPGVNA